MDGYRKIITFENDAKKCGLISESDSATLFEGEYDKTPKDLPQGSRALEGLLQRWGVKNKNRRIYTESVIKRETDKLNALIKENGGILGELDHPDTVTINLQKVCQRIDRVGYNNKGIVEGRIVLLPELPLGKCAIGICDALNGRIGQSSRGSGSLFEKADHIMVGEDYSMKTYDAVHDPSTEGARPTRVSESIIREFQEFCKARPASQEGRLSKLVDRYLAEKNLAK